MTSKIWIPSIDLPPDKKQKENRQRTVKFTLRDEPSKAKSETHEKQIGMFSGEYGADNPEKWCLFKHQLDDVFKRKPCTTPGAMYGVFSACLHGKALHHFDLARADVGDDTKAGFEATIQQLKQRYFDSDTPKYDQIQWVKTLKKPANMSWKEFVNFVEYIKANLEHFPEDVDDSGTAKLTQPVLNDEDLSVLYVQAAPTHW